MQGTLILSRRLSTRRAIAVLDKRRKSLFHFQFGLQAHHKNRLPRRLQSFAVRSLASSAVPVVDTDVTDPVEPSIEDQYSRKTPLEHVLLRPGMYVGPNERLPPEPCWVLDPPPPPPPSHLLQSPSLAPVSAQKPETPFRMVRKEYGVVPALVKIFDEILVNASDNRLRHPKSCTRLDVIIDPGDSDRNPYISIFNDGQSIPIEIHRREHIYVPELLFGHLLTGSNFNDDEKRLTGGRHGYGAKLTNIFSKQFAIDIGNAKRKLRYQQTWSHNMTQSTEPAITSTATAQDSTTVSFVPDMTRLTGDAAARQIAPQDYALMCRRVMDVAGCAAGQLTVTLNGLDLSQQTFADYTNLYRHDQSPPVLFHTLHTRWTVGVGLSETSSLESISFVNGMATSRGGTHVNAMVQQVTQRLQQRVEKLDNSLTVSQAWIRRHLLVACTALIENPTFDSQRKEYLTSSPAKFGCSYTLPESFLKQVVALQSEGGPGIVEDVLRNAQARQQASLIQQVGNYKKGRRLLNIPKLDDAHKAGTESGWDCTLILTEGDSAKALAVAGLEVIGRERFGVFPLRGKFLNVRMASVTQLTKNEEVKALCSILALDFEKKYETVKERRELRYGRVMLMTDQDQGKHGIVCALLAVLRLSHSISFRWIAHQGSGHQLLPLLLAGASRTTNRSTTGRRRSPLLVILCHSTP